MLRFDLGLSRVLRALVVSRAGGVLIYVAFSMPILIGTMALSIDLGRVFILNTELKDFADAAALAGAGELDGRAGARDAAYAAATTGLSGTLINIQAFATDGGGPAIAIDEVVFLRRLPSDGTNFTAADTATSDEDARFIFVSVVNRRLRSGLSRAVGVATDFESGARSIAGFTSVTCRVPAMWMCNPLEDPNFPVPVGQNCQTGTGVPLVGQEHCLTGRQMLMKAGGGKAAYAPGNFGLLDCPSGKQGTNCVAPFIAASSPDYCISDTVELRTGEAMGPIQSAINTRFDLYENPMFKGEEDNPDYRPALNVVKGFTGNGCNATQKNPPTVQPYPRDTCFASNSCASGRWGAGDWHQTTYDHDGDTSTPPVEPYWAINHPTLATTPPTDYATMTRYEVYRHEIENGAAADGIPNNSASGGENAHPQCYNAGTMSDPSLDADDIGLDEIDRRLMVLATVNCMQNGPLNGNETNVPIVGFAEVFLTEPAWGQGNEKANIFGELKGVLDPGESEVMHDIVQLYR